VADRLFGIAPNGLGLIVRARQFGAAIDYGNRPGCATPATGAHGIFAAAES